MVNDGDFPTKSRKVPPADSTLNFFQEEVVGNKTDAAVTSPTTTKSIMGYMKGALNQLTTIIGTLGKDFVAERNEVTWCDVNNTARFEVSIIDNDSGPVPAANITPGTITISRVRAGDTTVILAPAAFSEVDGKIYYDYTFLAASWATDDSFIAEADGVEFTIGGSTRYPSIPAWFGVIQDTATIEGKIDTIDGVVDGIQTDLDNATDGLSALKAEIDDNEAKIDLLQVDTTAIIADLDNATDGLGALKTEIDANETKIDLLQVDTTAIIADLDNATDGLGALKTEIDANETKIDLLQVDTTAIIADLDNATDGLGALKTEINANEAKIDIAQTGIDKFKYGAVASGDINILFPDVNQPNSAIEFPLAELTDDFIGDAEITAVGTISIYRYRKGTDAGWTSIVAAGVPAGTALGSLNYSYNFPNASWAIGDMVQVHMQGAQVTVNGNVFTIPRKTIYGVVGFNSINQDLADGGRLDALIDAIKAVTDLIPDAGAMTSLAQDLTVAKEATLGVPSGASLSADIAAIPLVTPDAAGVAAGLLAVPTADSALNVTAADVIGNKTDGFGGNSIVSLIRLNTSTLDGYNAVPLADSALNTRMSEVVGNKTDTVLGDSLVAHAKSAELGISLVKAVTDVLPDAGALTSLAQDLTVAKTGADSDTLETLSDQLDTITTATNKLTGETVNGVATENWNTAEQILEVVGAANTRNKVHSFWLSLNNLTAASVITIRMYIEINSTERKFYQTTKIVGTDPDGVLLIAGSMAIHEALKITVQSNTVADDGKSIDFSYVDEAM